MSNKVPMFDDDYYLEINEARWAMADSVLDTLLPLESCFDVGCGPGWFSERLVGKGLKVWGLDGRKELVDAAASRVPKATFSLLDITRTPSDLEEKKADLIFCFGLLYHLENPFAAIRNLYGMTGRYMFIETQIAPGEGNDLVIVSEGQNHTQGLKYHATIPSRNALLKMLYVSGFSAVYRFTGMVQHPDFQDTSQRRHRREIFMATKGAKFSGINFVPEAEPVTPKLDYSV